MKMSNEPLFLEPYFQEKFGVATVYILNTVIRSQVIIQVNVGRSRPTHMDRRSLKMDHTRV